MKTQAIQYNTIQYNTIQYNTMQCNTMQCNAMQCNTKQYNNLLDLPKDFSELIYKVKVCLIYLIYNYYKMKPNLQLC